MTDPLFDTAAAATQRLPRFAGLDLSLTSTGIALIDNGATTARICPPDDMRGHQRLHWIRAQIREHIPDHTIVAVEGPSYGSKGGNAHERAGLWWMTTHMLWRRRIPHVVITPAQLKKYATGVGSGPKSGKDQVIIAVTRRYPDVTLGSNDEADALVLAAMTADHYGHPIATVPAVNRAALATVKTWPTLTRSTPDA